MDKKGEDALANLSVEQEVENGPVTGFVRIRSRSQGLALSLGSLKGLNKPEGASDKAAAAVAEGAHAASGGRVKGA